jgi:hypothetical protein
MPQKGPLRPNLIQAILSAYVAWPVTGFDLGHSPGLTDCHSNIKSSCFLVRGRGRPLASKELTESLQPLAK